MSTTRPETDTTATEEPIGGDPACWAHFYDDAAGPDDAMLGRLVRQLADAVIVCDPSGRIVLWNDAATRLFGYPVQEAVGANLDLIIPERLRARHWDGWRRVMHTGETEYGDRLLEVPAMHADGRRMSIAFTVTLLTQPGQTAPVGIVAVIRDDTTRWQERREMRQELDAARKELGELRGAS